MAEPELVVDPAVSRRKFERELAQYRQLEDEHIKRGWWLLKAEFPEVFVVFAAPQLKPPSVVFGVVIDFTNYDLWPPSVRFVNPFTRRPCKASELMSKMPRRVTTATEPTPSQKGVQLQSLIQNHVDERPFLCLPGVREYHEHPAHSGDSWLLYRGSGEGTLYYLLDKIYEFGVRPINQYHLGVVEVKAEITGYNFSVERIPN